MTNSNNLILVFFNFFKERGPLVILLLMMVAGFVFYDHSNRKMDKVRLENYEAQTNKRFSRMEDKMKDCDNENKELNRYIRETHIKTLDKINNTLKNFER